MVSAKPDVQSYGLSPWLGIRLYVFPLKERLRPTPARTTPAGAGGGQLRERGGGQIVK